MSRKVTYARLQTSAYVPGAGELGNVIPSPNKTLESLEMAATDAGLEIKFTYKGLKKDILVPYANVVLVELAPAAEKAKS
jgi:hypothetical protein